MFSRYAALVKNMRGVVLFDPSDDVSQDLKWLIDRFKYRVLGVPPSLAHEISKESKVLVQLAYPHATIMNFVNSLANNLNIQRGLSEAICLASCYISPILALGPKSQAALESLATHKVTSRIDMKIQDWKLHLRIADYSILDLYEWSTTQAEKLWEANLNLNSIIHERLEKIRKDEKRYWRLQRGNRNPIIFLSYIDPVYMMHAKNVNIDFLRDYDKNIASACLAINVAVFIKPP